MDAGSILIGGAVMAAPIILASLGGLASERAGVINIGLEGKMLAAAGAAAFTFLGTGSLAAAIFAALAAGLAFSLLHAWLTQGLKMDHIISGMAINALALGGTSFARQVLDVASSGRSLPSFDPLPFFFAAVAAVAAGQFVLTRTGLGLRLRAVGEDPDRARESGFRPEQTRVWALAVCGLLCGASGAFIALNAGGFVDNMTAGRGYIALAALILGRWRPIPTALAGLAFGMLESLQIALQGKPLGGFEVPSQAWQALPYVVGLVALAGLVGHNKAPAGLGRQ